MSEAPVASCTGCRQPVGQHRALFGYTLCRTCMWKAAEKCTCEDCGCKTRVLPGQTPQLCFQCERNRWFDGKTCARCGRLPSKSARTRKGETVLCSACSSMQAQPIACEYCGEIGLNRSRNYQLGFTKLACRKCMRRHEFFNTCSGCRRHRLCAGLINGEPYCEMCYRTGAPPVITCSACRKRKYRFNKGECEDCAWERSHNLLIKHLSAEFKTEWAATLFERYHSEAKLKTMRGHWRKNLKRDVAFFQALETKFESPDRLNGVLIVRELGNDFVKRYRRAMSFLAYAGLIIMDDDPDYVVERAIDNVRRLTADKTEWIQQVLQRFLTHLLNTRARVRDRTRHARIPVSAYSLKSAVRSGHRLLAYARDEHGISSIQELSQDILNQFVGSRKLERTAVSAFVRYVRKHEKTFQSLKPPKGQALPVPAHLVMSEDDRRHFLRLFSNEANPGVRHWALICLLNLLYGQLPDRLVKLRLERVREGDEGYEIQFAKVWLPLAPIVQPLMADWMASRREKGAFDANDSSPYLFPGMRTGTHLTATASAYYRRKLGYNARAGRVTAFAVMIRGGLKQAKVLKECFGMSAIRAQAYLEEFGARHHDTANYVRHRHGGG